MNAAQIAAQLQAIDNEVKAGDIGWSNYMPTIVKLFDLVVALANRVVLLEGQKPSS